MIHNSGELSTTSSYVAGRVWVVVRIAAVGFYPFLPLISFRFIRSKSTDPYCQIELIYEIIL